MRGKRTEHRRAAAWLAMAAVGVGMPGCYTGLPAGAGDGEIAAGSEDGGSAGDESGSDGGDDGAGRPPEAPTDTVPVQTVPDDLTTIDSTGFCRAVGAGQEIVGVSPDGFLWLAQSMMGAGEPAIRFEVVDPWTESAEPAPTDLELGAMVSVHPRSKDDAVVVAAEQLWHVEGWSRVELQPPAAYSGAASACGNPRDNGFVLAAGTVFEHRSDGWWGLTPSASEADTPDRIVTVDGECGGPADETWLSAADGTVWRVGNDAVVHGLRFTDMVDVAGTADTLAVLADGEVWFGPSEWTRWDFEAGVPSSLGASDGAVWIAIGARLLRAVGEDFTELSNVPGGELSRVLPHPGGVWLQSGDEVCHQAIGPQLRVNGVHPYQRSPLDEVALNVQTQDPAAEVTATVDGEALALLPGVDGLDAVASLSTLGWHRIDLHIAAAGDEDDQTIWVRREVPDVVGFAADVAPIAEAHCSGDTCHSAMSTAEIPKLETFAAWMEHAAGIEERVVALDNMPPPGARTEAWGNDEVETIAKWIEGGMLP
ncbi:MAG: hypothetical protein AAF721_26460 [Myxococcota bacterium]